MRKSYSPLGIKSTREMVEHGANDWSERSLREVPASKHHHGVHLLKAGGGASCLVVTQDGASRQVCPEVTGCYCFSGEASSLKLN